MERGTAGYFSCHVGQEIHVYREAGEVSRVFVFREKWYGGVVSSTSETVRPCETACSRAPASARCRRSLAPPHHSSLVN